MNNNPTTSVSKASGRLQEITDNLRNNNDNLNEYVSRLEKIKIALFGHISEDPTLQSEKSYNDSQLDNLQFQVDLNERSVAELGDLIRYLENNL